MNAIQSYRAYKAFEAVNLNGHVQDRVLNAYAYAQRSQRDFEDVWLRRLSRRALQQSAGTRETLHDAGLWLRARTCRSAFAALEWTRLSSTNWVVCSASASLGSIATLSSYATKFGGLIGLHFGILELVCGRGQNYARRADDGFELNSLFYELNSFSKQYDDQSRSGLLGYVPEVLLVRAAQRLDGAGKPALATACLTAAAVGRALLQPVRLAVSAYTMVVAAALTGAHMVLALGLAALNKLGSLAAFALNERMPSALLYMLKFDLLYAAYARLGFYALEPRESQILAYQDEYKNCDRISAVCALGLLTALAPAMNQGIATARPALAEVLQTVDFIAKNNFTLGNFTVRHYRAGLQFYVALVWGAAFADSRNLGAAFAPKVNVSAARGAYVLTEEDPLENSAKQAYESQEVCKRAQELAQLIANLPRDTENNSMFLFNFAVGGAIHHLRRMCHGEQNERHLKLGLQVLRETLLFTEGLDVTSFVPELNAPGAKFNLRDFAGVRPDDQFLKPIDVQQRAANEADSFQLLLDQSAQLCAQLLKELPPLQEHDDFTFRKHVRDKLEKGYHFAQLQPGLTQQALQAAANFTHQFIVRHYNKLIDVTYLPDLSVRAIGDSPSAANSTPPHVLDEHSDAGSKLAV